jgi:hypothetical protein
LSTCEGTEDSKITISQRVVLFKDNEQIIIELNSSHSKKQTLNPNHVRYLQNTPSNHAVCKEPKEKRLTQTKIYDSIALSTILFAHLSIESLLETTSLFLPPFPLEEAAAVAFAAAVALEVAATAAAALLTTALVWTGAALEVTERPVSFSFTACAATAASEPMFELAATAVLRSSWFWAICAVTPASVCAVWIVLAEFTAAVVSVCWTAKQPPNGPAKALLRHLTVHTLPAEADENVSLDCMKEWTHFALTSSACHVVGHRNVDGEVLCFSLREAVDTGNVVGDSEVSLACGAQFVSSHVHVTHVWTSPIGVDLVNGNCHNGSFLHSRHNAGGELILGLRADIDVASQLRTTTLINDIGVNLCITNEGGILLARADSSAVSGEVWVDYQG